MNAGHAHRPQIPAWAAALQAGNWYRISGHRPDLDLPPTAPGTRYLEDNDPARDPTLNPASGARERLRRALGRRWIAPWRGRVGFPAITEAWNGAVYASRCGPAGAMVIFGGGHDDYYGADVHAFDLASREWRRLHDGFVTGTRREYGVGAVYPAAVYPNGSPLPPHTYNYVQYDALGNDFMLLKGQRELGPHVKSAAIAHVFNLDTLTWRRGPRHPTAILDSAGCSTWDARRRLLWGHAGDAGGGNAFVAYCPDGRNADGSAGAWRTCLASRLPGEADHNAMQLDPRRDVIVLACHARDALVTIAPDRPEGAIATLRSRGAKPRLQPYAMLDYAAHTGELVYYSTANGAAVYAIDCEDVPRWRLLSAITSLDPVADAAATSRYPVSRTHTFGRFRVASFDTADLAILIRHVDTPVYAMRLSV